MAILVFEHSDLAGSGRLGETLRNHGHLLRVLSLQSGDAVPVDLDDVDGIICCGASDSACSDTPPDWFEPEMALVREAHEREMPVVGICFGSQLVARALGGTVEPLDGGVELGWIPVELNHLGREDVLHAGIPWSSLQPSWHRDHVAKLPDGARVLATSPRCIQCWAAGLRTYGIQYHPEVYPETLESWATDEPKDLEEAGITLDELRQQTREQFPTCLRLSQRLFEAIALCLMPVDRRHQGLVKDLHH